MAPDQLEKLVESLVEQQIKSKLTEQYISAATERVLIRDQDNLLRFVRAFAQDQLRASAKQYIESVLPTLSKEIVNEAVRSVMSNRDNIKLVQDMFRQALGAHVARFVSKTATALDKLLKEETP
jgi:nitrogen-specific signal transduction histidine kinase